MRDAMGLMLTARLADQGLPPGAAGAIAWAARGEWPKVIASPSILMLLVEPNLDGPEPYLWSVASTSAALVRFRPGVRAVDMTAVAAEKNRVFANATARIASHAKLATVT